MALATGDIVRADVIADYNAGSDIVNTYHFRLTTGGMAESAAVDRIIEIMESIYAVIGAILPLLYTIRNIRIVNVTQGTDVGNGNIADTTPGAVTGDTQGLQCAFGVSLGTSRLRVRGRKFLGPVCESQVADEGLVTSGPLLDLVDYAAILTAPIVVTGSTWQAGVIATSDSAWLPFISATISPTVVTQRRRRLGVGA